MTASDQADRRRSCLNVDELDMLLAGGVVHNAAAELHAHLKQCRHCASRREELRASLRIASGVRGHPPVEPIEPPPESNRVPGEVGPYRVIRKLGEGGMGSVYEAEPLLRDCLQLRRDVLKEALEFRLLTLGPDQIEPALCRLKFGHARWMLKDAEGPEPLLRSAEPALRWRQGTGSGPARAVSQVLAEVYEAMGRHDDARVHCQRASTPPATPVASARSRSANERGSDTNRRGWLTEE